MADFFGSIAAGEIGAKRLPLVFPEPAPKNGVIFEISDKDSSPQLQVPAKMSTKEELDREINRLRDKYTPFMRHMAPKFESARISHEISAFDIREACDEDLCDFSRVLRGEGEWKHTEIPYYFGPVGNVTTFYRKVFNIKRPSETRALFIHFDGVDYIAEIFVNGTLAGTHEGFFGAFEFDITPYVNDGENILVITVKNDYIYGGNQSPVENAGRIEGDKLYAATGPGYDDAELGWHHCPPGSGIYQKVYLEERDRVFISDVFVRPMIDSGEFEIWCEIYNSDYIPPEEVKLSYSVYGSNFESTVFENFEYIPITFAGEDYGNTVSINDFSDSEKMKKSMKLSFGKGANLVRLCFKMDNTRLWTLDEPYLYEARIKLYVNGKQSDIFSSRFGMRSFTQNIKDTPKGMFFLNGNPIRLRGANTMGFEQQDVIRGDFDALLYDMLMAKACNMNFLRITQRPVQKEIYELCDSIGLMIQTDLPLFTVIRRTKFSECIRQAEEMEKLIRSHPSCILVSYINEPMSNGGNRPHRHLVRYETELFFEACDAALKILNPDRVIKHIDGDYDPPDSTFPDNHCYSTWYNGHGIDIGKLIRGHWLGVKEGWYYGCGEFGAEGLDPVRLMKERYPAEWLPDDAKSEKTWEPGKIKDSQSGNMHFFFYDTQDTLEDWVRESRKYQALATKIQTEAFRRDSRMASFAIHLFIDAWPSGWMKTIVDCQREPKPAFFEYRDALTPLMVSIRNNRKSIFSEDIFSAEIFVCNDTQVVSDSHKIVAELLSPDEKKLYGGSFDASFEENSAFLQGEIRFRAPKTKSRETYTLRAALLDKDGNVVHYSDEDIEVFPRTETEKCTIINKSDAIYISAEEFLTDKEKFISSAMNGKTLIVNSLPNGTYNIAGTTVNVKSCGMRPLHFVSRKTFHPLVAGFKPYDFRFWYDEKKDMITPILYRTFTGEGLIPILLSGNSLKGSAWGQKLYPAFACAEMTCGKGKIIINEVELDSHLENPVARIFKNRLLSFR